MFEHDWRRFFRMLDQICIYFLIAGSFTPIAVVFLWNGWWPLLLGLMWLLAMLGALLVLRLRWLDVLALRHVPFPEIHLTEGGRSNRDQAASNVAGVRNPARMASPRHGTGPG